MAEPTVVGRECIVHARGEGEANWMLGGLYETRLSAEETGGVTTAIEFTVPAGMGPPPHRHEQDEIVYIIEGTARYHLDGRTVDVGPGSILFLPKGAVETFEPTSTMRMLGLYLPGGMDRFFAAAGEPAARREVPPAPTSPPDIQRLTSLGAQYGLELLPPNH